ncbi:MAG: Ig-like domain-containing protein [Pseudomonadota bacterium]
MASEKTNVAFDDNNKNIGRSAPPPPSVDGALDNAGDIQDPIAHGGVTDDRQPDFHGQGTPGDTVVILDHGVEIGTTTVDANGQWEFTPSTDLVEGLHAITVVARNAAGEESEPSPAFNFEIDVTPPDASQLAITGVMDAVGSVTGNVAPGGTTDDASPVISGASSGVPGHIVIVMVKDAQGERELGRATIGEGGRWTLQVDPPLAAGLNVIRVYEKDAAGNETALTAPYRVTVNTDAPSPPVIESVYDDVGTPHLLQPGEVTDDARPTLAGTAQANHTVKLYDGATFLGEVVADANGRWAFTPTAALPDGPRHITATSTSPLGQTSDASNAWDFVVDTAPPQAPVIVAVADDVGSIVTPHMANGATTDDTRPGFTGTAEANSTVAIYDDGVEIGRVQADASGHWTFTPATALSEGPHRITVTAIDRAGNTSAPSELFGFTVDTTAPTQTATLTAFGKDSGTSDSDFLTNDGSAGRLMRGSLTAPLGAGETLQVSTDGGKTWKPAIVTGDKWSAQDDHGHAGNWTVHTRVIDAAGNTGATTSHTVALDTTAPAAPTAMTINGAQATVAFDKANAEVGGRVSLANGDKRYDHVLTAADVAAGRVVINAPFALGAQTTASLVDKAGNVSAESLRESVYLENFNSITGARALPTGASYKLGSLTFYSLSSSGGSVNGMTYPQGLYASNYTPYMHQKPYSNALWVAGSIRVSLDDSLVGNKLSFYIGDNNNYATIRLYAKDGSLLHSASMAPLNGTINIDVSSTGKSFSRFEIATYYNAGQRGNDQLWIDDIRISSSSKVATTGVFTLTADSAAVLNGDAGNNVFQVGAVADFSDSGIAGNGGLDTLMLTGANQVLDLVALGAKVSSIEVVDLTGTGNNTLNLSLASVMENGAVDQFVANGRVQMLVKGNAGDTVSLSGLLPDGTFPGDWVQAGTVTLDGVVYTVYAHSGFGADLLVEQGVTVTLGVGTTLTIDALGKDSGAPADFVTADGSAGRVVTGSLSGALPYGLKVQVSVDGGQTWHDATVNGKQWAFVDTQAHSGDWRVQARVSDGQGHSSEVAEREVTLVAAPEAPSIVRIAEAEGIYTTTKAQDGSLVNVSLAGTGAKAGDTVHVQWGMSTYDQVLTQVDIASGTATLKVPATVTYSYQGAAKDFAVTVQVIGKDGALGAVSKPYEVVGTAALTMASDTLQKAPVGDVYTGTGFKVTTTGSLSYKAATTTTLAGLTLNDTAQANALFTLDKPANYFTLRLTGIDNAMGAQIQVFDVKGNLIHIENFIGGTDARHTKTFAYTSAELVDIGSFKVISLSTSVTLDAFSQRVVNHVAETRDPNLIDYAPETFYGTAGDDVVSLSVNATTYFNQATAAIHGGSGIDTLKLVGYAHVLDLTKVGTKLSSMEIIDITGTSYNTLTLSLAEVLNNGGVDLFYTGDKSRVQMMVKGNAGDTVNLSDLLAPGVDQGDWIKKSSVTVQGVAYDVYQFSTLAAELLVQQGVTVKLSNVALKAFSLDLGSDDALDHATQAWTQGDDTLIARLGFADRLEGGAGNDTFTKVGTGDTVHGGAGDDVIHVLSGDFARVDGGLGIDTLVMDGTAMRIDLAAFGLKIQGIEKFDLGAGGNTLALHASDVLAGGMRDMVMADGKVQMLVNGANGDVNLLGGSAGDDGWSQGGNTTVSGVTYSVYTNLAGTAELLVEDRVHVTLM